MRAPLFHWPFPGGWGEPYQTLEVGVGTTPDTSSLATAGIAHRPSARAWTESHVWGVSGGLLGNSGLDLGGGEPGSVAGFRLERQVYKAWLCHFLAA